MTLEQWQAAEEHARALTGQPVVVTLINDHAVSGVLTGVGYAGLRILPPGVGHESHYEHRLISRVEAQP